MTTVATSCIYYDSHLTIVFRWIRVSKFPVLSSFSTYFRREPLGISGKVSLCGLDVLRATQ